MKAKTKDLKKKKSKINNTIKTLVNSETKKEGENPFPNPISVQCFECEKQFWVKFVIPQKDYSKKNNLGYYSEKAEDLKKWLCNFCLRDWYLHRRKELLSITKNHKKINHLSSYIVRNII